MTDADREELSILREFWDTFWNHVSTVDVGGYSGYEHEDMSRLEAAQDKVYDWYCANGGCDDKDWIAFRDGTLTRDTTPVRGTDE